jgi:hypothetical protein
VANQSLIDAEMLRKYIENALPPEELTRVEKAVRESSELREQLEAVRNHRQDANLHSLGSIWQLSRLTCPSRQQLGSLLLDAIDPDLADYFRFHIDVIECPYCQANLADLKGKAEAMGPAAKTRHKRIWNSSRHLLPEDGRS